MGCGCGFVNGNGGETVTSVDVLDSVVFVKIVILYGTLFNKPLCFCLIILLIQFCGCSSKSHSAITKYLKCAISYLYGFMVLICFSIHYKTGFLKHM